MTADAGTAARFGLSLPAGFGTDYAGWWTRPVTG
jgi:hypothetical protein